LDAALAAREVTRKAAAKPAPVTTDDLDEVIAPPKAKAEKAKPAPVEVDDDEPAPPKKAKKAEPEPVAKKSGGSDLLADLDDLLGNKDD